jgi:undecaprenyl diphosphate synthase
MLEKFFRRIGAQLTGLKRLPKHIAIDIDNNVEWQKKKQAPISEVFGKRDSQIIQTIEATTKFEIPVLTLLLCPSRRKDPAEQDSFIQLFKSPRLKDLLHKNQVKLSVLGKWYDLPGHLVQEIKDLIDSTKDFDRFFVNFCINYNGQDEIVDACKLISRKIKAQKLEISSINRETIKDNLYSSYFLPPDMIIKTGKRRSWSDLLLWDSPNARYFFTNKYFLDLSPQDLWDILREFQDTA